MTTHKKKKSLVGKVSAKWEILYHLQEIMKLLDKLIEKGEEPLEKNSTVAEEDKTSV